MQLSRAENIRTEPTSDQRLPNPASWLSGAGWTIPACTPYPNSHAPPPHIQKLNDGFADFLVDVTCQQCHKGKLFRPDEFAEKVGWHCRFEDLVPKMHFQQCGATATVTIIARAKPRPRGLSKNPR
jgi:hypothetical protein